MLFSSAARAGPRPLVQFKAGKMALSGTTLAPEKRKGELAIHQSEDGLMHVTWTDLAASAPEDDLIVFPQEVSLKRIAQCKDAYAMVLGWTTSSRKIFFWSQELRKKGAAADDFAAEDALVAKFNSTVDNPPTPGSGGGGGGGGGGTIGGLSQSNYNELMAMLQRNAGATRVEPAPAPTPAPTPASSAPTPSATPSVAPTAATPAAPMAERTHAASATPAAAAPITSEGLQAILRGVMQRSHTAQQDGACGAASRASSALAGTSCCACRPLYLYPAPRPRALRALAPSFAARPLPAGALGTSRRRAAARALLARGAARRSAQKLQRVSGAPSPPSRAHPAG